MRSPALVGLPISPYNLSFFLDCFHMKGGVPHLGRLPSQPCRVTRLGGVSFLHVNAEGGVVVFSWHLSLIKPIERLTGQPKNVKFNAQYFG